MSRPASPSELSQDILYSRISSQAKQLDKVEDEGIEIAKKVDSLHNQIKSSSHISPLMRDNLRDLYTQGIEQARREEELLQSIAKGCDQLLQVKQPNNTGAIELTQGGTIQIPSTPAKSTVKTNKVVSSPLAMSKGTSATPKASPASFISRSAPAKAAAMKAAAKQASTSTALLAEDSQKKKRLREEVPVSGQSAKNNKRTKMPSNVKNDGILTKGRAVAAREPKTRNEEENYIMATVRSYNVQSKQYEVEDADETAQERIFLVHQKHVLPIPKREQVTSEFPSKHTVFAVYPQTTTFYKAEVVLPPSKTMDRPNIEERDKYLLAFEDDGGAKRPADIIHVLEYPKNR